jgi:hypothetical protein
MATIQFLNELFDAHVRDLQDFYCGEEDLFVCPICLTGFSREAINQRLLTDGHVWPNSVRKISEKARQMHVLLCRRCNHVAGARGDAQMQIHEQILARAETGHLDRGRVQLIRNQNNSPINLNNVDVTYHPRDNSWTITGRVDNNGKWQDGNPEDQLKFSGIYQNREPVKPLFLPSGNYKSELAQAGWITSAYLTGFYCLGYRFILDSSLDIVRKYIICSFDSKIKRNPVQLNPDDLGIWVEDSNKYVNPELFFMVPFEAGKRVYLQANCLRYRIRLPFRYLSSVFFPVLQKTLSDLNMSAQTLREEKATLFFQIPRDNIGGNRSWYDQLLGTPHIKHEQEKKN